ncbi:lipopolysaccharide-induced tumor necrosis factor-alpha factor homolog [Glandiceps talaboti]
MAYQPFDRPFAPSDREHDYPKQETGITGSTQQTSAYPPKESDGYPDGHDQAPPVQPAGTTQTTTVVVTQPDSGETITVRAYGEMPVVVTCPSCQQNVLSRVSYEPGIMAWCCCVLLCFVGCLLCMWIPLCMNSCADAIHKCPNCHNHLRTHRR